MTDLDWVSELAEVERDGAIATPLVRQAIGWLAGRLPVGAGSRILDVGAGPGYATTLLAEAFPRSEVVAVDPTAPFVARATERFAELGLDDRVRAVHDGIGGPKLAELAPADLVWCAHVVHHLPDPVTALRAIGRSLSAQGALAIAEGGLPTRFLPGGYGVSWPSFVNRLEATLSDYYVQAWSLTETAVGGRRDWPMLLADAGLRHRASRTFLLDIPAPVDQQVRHYAVDRFARIQQLIGDRLSDADAAALARLLDPRDPAALVNRPDLFMVSATTFHLATRQS
jgi:SAM-dependent methyltransferase